MEPRQLRELEHNRKILNAADKVWGRSGFVGIKRVERRAKLIIDSCGINASKSVLEIGSGTGTLTKFLAQTGAKVVATDLFEEFLNISKNEFNTNNVQYVVADAEKLDNFSEKSFDVVCGLSILHHLKLDLALQSMYRVLKPGGCFAFSEPNILNPQIMVIQNSPFVIRRKFGYSEDERAFSKWHIRKFLESFGFKNISATPFDFLHPVIPTRLANIVESAGLFIEKVPIIREIAGSIFIFAKK